VSVFVSAPSPCSAESAELGEGTRWDARRGELLWVDIAGGTVRRSVPGAHGLRPVRTYQLDVTVGVAAPLADGTGWVLAAGDGFALLAEDGELRWLERPEQARGGATRMNDGACDPAGRFWAGSMAFDERSALGSLYRLDPDLTLHTVLTGATVSNGLGWSPDARTMYYADSGTATLDALDYDLASGAVENRRTLVAFRQGEGLPDGLVVDDEGFVWIALWGGAAVRRYDPSGALAESVPMPVSQPSCCCLGGPARSTLYVSSACVGLAPSRLAAEPDAGRVFAVETRVTGPPATPFG
jgi:sugar lactone lactonase YvrE